MRLFVLLLVTVVYIFVASARPDKGSKRSKHQNSVEEASTTTKGTPVVTPPIVTPGDDVTEELQEEDEFDIKGPSRRKSIIHSKPYNKDLDLSMELFRETMSRHLGQTDSVSDPCHYMRCGPGQECEVMKTGAKCVCRRHCKQRHKPLCGTDDNYYDNHCEMHRAACLSGRDIYDARHKDCFYKASRCNQWDLKQYQNMLMQYYKNMLTRNDIRTEEYKNRPSEEKALIREKRGTNIPRRHREHKRDRQDQLDILPEEDDIVIQESEEEDAPEAFNAELIQDKEEAVTTQAPEIGSIPIDLHREMLMMEQDDEAEIMTRDTMGDMVKYIFTFMDIDSNQRVGSDEMGEVTSLQHLDNVLPAPCSLFHLLKYGDVNNDRTLDLAETFKLFNITVYHLRRADRYVRRPAAFGSPAQLECGIEGEQKPVWHRYGRELQEMNGARVEGRILHLSDVTAMDAGNYTCRAQTRVSMRQIIDLQVLVPPKVQVHPHVQHPAIESSATIKCHVDGRPRPQITWNRNGEPLDVKSDRYILMANHTELHFNTVGEEDSAAYSCLAGNSAGTGEDIGTIYVQAENSHEVESDASPAYFVFHRDGISVVSPHSCQIMRTIHSHEKIPGLLMQDKLCELNENGQQECVWSTSVSVGSRYIYAAQPTEDRLVVVDKELQRVVEIITTDLMPVQLYYVASTDQVYILCWVDEFRNGSVLQVIHAASKLGNHFAEHIRPIRSHRHRDYDRSVYDIFIPPETPLHPTSKYGYVIHKDDSTIHRLDFSTLLYTETVDLTPFKCKPVRLNYLPIGGLLHVTCLGDVGVRALHLITIDVQTDVVVEIERGIGMSEEFFSDEYSYAIQLYPERDMINLYNISSSGKMNEFMIIRTNFAVSDVFFVRKKYNPDAMVAYMVAKNQGDIMYVDLEKKKVEIIDGMTPPLITGSWPWAGHTRKLAPSDWFGWFLATSGRTGMEVVGLNSNQVLCRMNDFVLASAISWSNGEF